MPRNPARASYRDDPDLVGKEEGPPSLDTKVLFREGNELTR